VLMHHVDTLATERSDSLRRGTRDVVGLTRTGNGMSPDYYNAREITLMRTIHVALLSTALTEMRQLRAQTKGAAQ
jgi:hypothetical protein